MKILRIALAGLVFALTSCENSGEQNAYLLKSLGNINTLQVIIENDLWNGEVGEEIRGFFAAPIDGLPQDEPLFSMNQMPPSTYTDFARKYRTFLHVTIGDTTGVAIKKNPYAKPQIGAFIVGKDIADIKRLLEKNYQQIISAFKKSEIIEKQRRIKISLKKTDSLKKFFGVNMRLPSAYRSALETEDFIWYRKALKSGETNIIVYQVPLGLIRSDSTSVADIITIRDSIGGDYMPVEEGGRFITEEAYAPYIFKTKIDDRFAYETKGIWEVKTQFMGGPFINYAVRDSINNRYLIIEGFVYAPATSKRDLQFELEAILRSMKFE
ncbi:MAG: DUF4837 family protein [Bacteroidia bacterium]|nr:DUF4837 family protein [Bacteroidia bacterium]MBT8275578.1 DUF4837 family protein [Bacteroidia bacterium]NNF31503.1 DUF4837 family protein [Flavobacteriaceae bacterium]NNK54082.1 DUF4837 family protein [Flavobacteriaceae bacterium]NNM07659.1 DUF4837 family protein [Flavobacteriaceae bacterium]